MTCTELLLICHDLSGMRSVRGRVQEPLSLLAKTTM